MVCGLSSSERVERVERVEQPRNHKPENPPQNTDSASEPSPQRVGRLLAVAVVVVRGVLVAGGLAKLARRRRR